MSLQQKYETFIIFQKTFDKVMIINSNKNKYRKK